MARQVLAPQSILKTGLLPVYTAAAPVIDGHSIVNAGKTFVHVKNGGGGATICTIQTPGTIDDNLAIADRTVSIPAGSERMIGPFIISIYNQTGGVIWVDFDVITTVTLAALTLP